MSKELDPTETRELARRIVNHIHPDADRETTDLIAGDLIRLMARMVGHVGESVTEANYDNDPESDGRAAFIEEIGEQFTRNSVDAAEVIISGERCYGCGEYGDNGACVMGY